MNTKLLAVYCILWSFMSAFVFADAAIGQEEIAIEKLGALIMAHGGSDDWNAAVEEAITPLRDACPVVIAFGMGERESLQEGVARLEAEGIHRVAVVRLYISGASFLHQTEYLLGVRPDPPAQFVQHDSHAAPHSNHTASMPHPDSSHADSLSSSHKSSIPASIQTSSKFVLSIPGLAGSSHMGEILRERVKALSRAPAEESVLILAHGAGDEEENGAILAQIADLAKGIEQLGPFRAIKAETLREDWPDERMLAEVRIRAFVTAGNQNSGRVIVVPFRLFGFGPYAKVLEGLSYVSDSNGLLPHPLVTDWIKTQVEDCCSRAGWRNPFTDGSVSR